MTYFNTHPMIPVPRQLPELVIIPAVGRINPHSGASVRYQTCWIELWHICGCRHKPRDYQGTS